MAKYLMYDNIYSGHHKSYAKNLLNNTVDTKIIVNYNQIDSYADIDPKKISIIKCKDPGAYRLTIVGWLINFYMLITHIDVRHKENSIVFLYGDSMIIFISLFKVLYRQKKTTIVIHWANAVIQIENYKSSFHKYARKLKFMCFKWISNIGTKIIVHGERTKAILEKEYQEINISNVPYGIEEIDLQDKGSEDKELNTKKKVLFFGGIRKDKGIEKLVRVAKLKPNYDFYIYGKPNDYSEKELIKMFNGIENLHYTLGFIDDDKIPGIFTGADSLILPYEYYFSGQSGPLTLATAYRVPVLATNVGDMGYDIAKYNLGMVVKDNRPELLGDGLDKLFSSDLAKITSSQESYYNDSLWSKVGASFESIFKSGSVT